MERAIPSSYLLPPPRLLPNDELPPHLDRLELAPYTGRLPDEIEPFTPAASEDPFTAERATAVAERVLDHQSVRQRLAGAQWELIGASRRSGKDEARQVVVVIYDYGRDTAIEVTADEEGSDILSVSDFAYQPPLTHLEIERAVGLAHADERIAHHDLTDLVTNAIPLDPPAQGEPGAGHRVLEVLFGCANERLPRYRAIVDLSDRRVLRAGLVDDCCGQEEQR